MVDWGMVRLKDIAAQLRLNESTVSRALADHPSIPAHTRQRVRRTADSLGYTPDPSLRRLAQMRWRGSHAERAASLALVRWSGADYLPIAMDILPRVGAAARRVGYGFEEVVVSDYTSPVAAARCLRARGVSGIIAMASTQADAWIDFPWEQFSGVQLLTGSGRDSGLATIRPDVFGALLDAGRRVAAVRPRSAAIVLFKQNSPSLTDLRDEAAAGLVLQQWRDLGIPTLPIAKLNAGRPDVLADTLMEWLKENRPGAVILPNSLLGGWMQNTSYRIPENVGIVTCRRLGSPLFAGYEVCHERIVSLAVQMIDGLVRSSHTGLPDLPESVVVPCRWCDGPSFPAR
jgi:LacI family transcriptional regulator